LFIRDPDEWAKPPVSPSPDPVRPPEYRSSAKAGEEKLTSSPAFWLLLAVAFLSSMSLTGTVTLIVPLLAGGGLSPELATSVLSLAGIASTAGRLLSGYLLDRFLAAYIAASFFLLAIGGIVLLNSDTLYAAIPGGFLLGLGMGAETSILVFLVGRYFWLRRFGEACGYVLAVLVLGNGAGPWLMTMAYDLADSYTLAQASFGLALLASVALVFRLGPYRYPTAEALAESRP
jgi:predicted MFS family arabinose efflux permease